MKKENNNQTKKNIVSGASALTGAAAGVAGAAVLSADDASAQEVSHLSTESKPLNKPAAKTPEPEDKLNNQEETSNEELVIEEIYSEDEPNAQERLEEPLEHQPNHQIGDDLIGPEPWVEPLGSEPNESENPFLYVEPEPLIVYEDESAEPVDSEPLTVAQNDIIEETVEQLNDTEITAEVVAENHTEEDIMNEGQSDLTAEVVTNNAEVFTGDVAEEVTVEGVDSGSYGGPEVIQVSAQNDEILAQETQGNQGDIDLHDADIDVLGYDRLTNDNGDQIEVAAVNINGETAAIIDTDLDGVADYMMSDRNQNGVIENSEILYVHDQGLEMQPLQDAAGFDTALAQDDLPDYVNDADVDVYMA